MHSLIYLLLVLSFFQFYGLTKLKAQESSFKSDLTAGLSLGIASFYGDLSKHDYNPFNKVGNESGPLAEFYAGKRFNLLFELDLSLAMGKTHGKREDLDTKFLSKFNIYSISTSISMAEILFSDRVTILDYGIIAGASLAQFRSASFKISDNSPIGLHGLDEDGKNAGSGNMGANLTGGYYISYPLSPEWTIQFRQTFEFLTTDKFDSYIGTTGISDRLLLSRIGIKYIINPTLTRVKYDLIIPGNKVRAK